MAKQLVDEDWLHFKNRETTASIVNHQGEMMKKKVFSVMATCCFLTLFAAATVPAQLPGTALRATIPFDFIVRGKMLPAGQYEIKRLGAEPDNLMISGINHTHDRAMFETESVAPKRVPSRGEVVFHRYGDRYFLAAIFSDGEQTGRELPACREERRLRQVASNGNKAKPETVALAAY